MGKWKGLQNYSSKYGKAEDDSKSKIFMIIHTHFFFIHSVFQKCLILRNEEKLLALPVYSFFIRVEKFELFEDFFQTMLKMQPEMSEAMKINHFYARLENKATQTFRNIKATNKKTLQKRPLSLSPKIRYTGITSNC